MEKKKTVQSVFKAAKLQLTEIVVVSMLANSSLFTHPSRHEATQAFTHKT